MTSPFRLRLYFEKWIRFEQLSNFVSTSSANTDAYTLNAAAIIIIGKTPPLSVSVHPQIPLHECLIAERIVEVAQRKRQ